MSFAEKRNWVFLGVVAATYLAYLGVILSRAGGAPVAGVPYMWPMIGAIGAGILLTIVGSILVAVPACRAGEKRFEPDERDRSIERHGEVVGYSAFSIGILGALILTMTEAPHFWIGNAIYLSFVLAAQIGTGAKLVAYRRGA